MDRLLNSLSLQNRFFVDVGASDGQSMSNTLALAEQGWTGLAAECDGGKFASLSRAWREFPVSLWRGRVTPENIGPILMGASVPNDFTFLSLDIDSYDAFVLERILMSYRPALVCAEINETIPPPVRFSVRPHDGPIWSGGNFFGQSIAHLADVATAAGYVITELHYNNAFLVPREAGLAALSAEEAYASGYRNRSDRDAKFPYNSWMTEAGLWDMTPDQLFASVRSRFAGQSAPYLLKL